MDFRQALDAVEARLKLTRRQVIPNPPRQLPTNAAVFFASIDKQRVSQDGGNEIRLGLIATTSSQHDWKFDELQEATDVIDAVVDANDIDGIDLTMLDGDGWSMGLVEVGGVAFFGARCDLTIYY